MNEKGKSFRDFSLAIALLVICGFFALVSPQFLGARNLSLLLTELSITATLALGMLLVILPGHIDLSVGSGVGLLGGIASVLIFEHHWPAPAAMALSLLIGLLIWFGMGTFVFRHRFPPFSPSPRCRITPPAPPPAPLVAELAPEKQLLSTGSTILWYLTGLPAMATPCGFTSGDKPLPLSMQIIGKPFAEETVFKLCHAYQCLTDFHLQVPPIAANVAVGV